MTDVRISVVKASSKTSPADRVLITGDFTNVGSKSQRPETAQHAELVRDGNVLQTQPLPALQAGVTYPLQFRIFRPTDQRKDSVAVTVRYVLDDPHAARSNNCTPTNDSMQKTF